MKKYILYLLLSCSFHTFSQDVIQSKFGQGLYNVVAADSSFSMKFGLRIQSLMSGERVVNDTSGIDKGTSEFLIRRARLKFDGFVYSPKVQYKVELGLSNRDIGRVDSRNNNAPNVIFDAVIKWNFYKNFTLWAGQTKLPGNRERVVSSANMQLVDRSNLNSEFNIDRDVGVQLHHHFKMGKNFIVVEKLALSQGEGRNIVQENLGGFEYTGRVEILPFGNFASKGDYFGSDLKREAKAKLSLAVTYDFNDRSVKDRGNQGAYMTYDLDNDGSFDGYFEASTTTLFADMMFKYKGFSMMVESALRDSKNAVNSILNIDLTTTTRKVSVGKGLNVQAGYLLKNNWEVAGRFTKIVPGSILGKAPYDQYTVGVSKFIVGHKLKVQTDLSYQKEKSSTEGQLLYRIQFELHL
jgi:phosphate-selective porin OprO and OprP